MSELIRDVKRGPGRKVLHVVFGGAWGGGSVVVMAITRGLLERGDEVWVACTDDENERRFAEAGAHTIRLNLWRRSINPLDALLLIHLWWICWRMKFDLVATHTSKGGLLGRIAARLAGIRNIVHYAHGFAFNKDLGPLGRRFFIGLEKLGAKAGDFIVSVNDEHRRMAIELGIVDASKICTVRNGVDLCPFDGLEYGAARRAAGIPDSTIAIGTTGRLAPQKGFVHLIRSMPAVVQALPAAKLYIAGDGPLLDELRTEAQTWHVADHVEFLGFRRDTHTLLVAFDVFALPSLWEGLSISLLEALAAGKAIVAAGNDGNREAITDNDNGILVPPADHEALAAALIRVLTDPALARRLAAAARRSAEERFSEQRMVEQNLAVYDSLLARQGHQPVRAIRPIHGEYIKR